MKEDIAAGLDPKDVCFEVAHLTAIVLIKARLITKAQEINDMVKFTLLKLAKQSGKPHGQVEQAFQGVKNRLTILSDQELENQKALLDKYLAQLLRKNPTVVKAMVNPVPLLSGKPSRYMALGSPEQAYLVVNQCIHLFRANTWLMAKMQQLVGPRPDYPTKSEFNLLFPNAL